LETEFVVRRTAGDRAEIIQGGHLVGYIEHPKSGRDLRARLETEDGTNRVYEFDPRVDGAISTFSYAIFDEKQDTILKIKSGCFSYVGKVYVFKSLPEGTSMKRHLSGTKSICRLDNLPYQSVDEIDRETREKLYRHRGVEVGRLSGFGRLGHKVTLDDDLSGIALPLSAASYLLYAAG
jgi:hypothetical protein